MSAPTIVPGRAAPVATPTPRMVTWVPPRSGPCEPNGQRSHSTAPEAFENDPGAHSKHSARPVTLAKLPELQFLGPVFPPEQYLVTGHGAQSALETKVTPEGRNVPGKHAAGMRTLESGGQ